MQQLRYILAHPFQTKITEITKNVRKNDKITENDKITKRQAEFKTKRTCESSSKHLRENSDHVLQRVYFFTATFSYCIYFYGDKKLDENKQKKHTYQKMFVQR